jgi:hypothetical protein
MKSKKGNHMKKLLAVFLLCLPLARAAGTVTSSVQAINQGGTAYIVTVNWQGDASTGSVPTTTIAGLGPVQGYQITQIQTVPGTPAPTAGYSITVKDQNGYDMAGGQATTLSATAAASFATTSAVPPVVGSLSFALTGNSVASARGKVLLYIFKPSVLAAANLLGRYGTGGGGGAVDSVFGRIGAVVAAEGDYAASQVSNAPAGNISATDVQAALNELDADKQAAGNYITALSGDVTATGPGSAAATLATVNANTGACGDSTHVCQVTLNAKGLATAASPVAITGGGTVTVVGSGSLTSTAIVTGGGSQALQTPCGTCTLDSSGNFSTPGQITTGVGSGVAGTVDFVQGTAPTPLTNGIAIYAPTSVATAYGIELPGAVGSTGVLHNTTSGAVSTWSYSQIVNADVSSSAALALSKLATQSADTVVMNATGSAAVPTAVAMPTGGTNGCAGASNAVTYNTSTHAFGCNTISGGSGYPALLTAAWVSGGKQVGAGSTVQQAPIGRMDQSYDTSSARYYLQTAGTLQNLCVYTFDAQPGTGSMTITTFKNGSTSSQVATVTSSGAAGRYCDTTNTLALASGDYFYYTIVNNASGTSAQILWSSVEVVP